MFIKKLKNQRTDGILRRSTLYILSGVYRCGCSFCRCILDVDWSTTGEKTFFRSKYLEHVKDLMKTVVDNTDQHIGSHRKEDDFGTSIMNDPLKENILQHLFSYQETNHVKIFDLYGERIKLKHGLRSEFSHIFYRYFSEINTSSNSDFGVCKGCIDKFGFWEKMKHKKILKSFPQDT
ncbi:MAG: hypothetical protein ACRDFB_10430 [Rhabdochlamydiaceae bacterium]